MAELELALGLDKSNFADRFHKALAETVAKNTPIETLIVRNNNLDAQCLREIFNQKSLIQNLKNLVLSQNFSAKNGDEAVQLLTQLLFQYASSSGNAVLPLQKLDLAFNNITAEGCSSLFSFLANSNTLINLRELNLRYNNLGTTGAAQIASIISQGSGLNSLQSLDLTGNAIGDNGFKSLCLALSTPQAKIKSLIAWGNGISDASAPYICNMLKVNRTLVNLDLSSNNLSQQSLESIYKIFEKENLNIEYIGIHGNMIKDRHLNTKFNDLATKRCHVKSVQREVPSTTSQFPLSAEAKSFLMQPIPVVEPLSRSEIIAKYYGNNNNSTAVVPLQQPVQGVHHHPQLMQQQQQQQHLMEPATNAIQEEWDLLNKSKIALQAEKEQFEAQCQAREDIIKQRVKQYIEQLLAEAAQKGTATTLNVVFK